MHLAGKEPTDRLVVSETKHELEAEALESVLVSSPSGSQISSRSEQDDQTQASARLVLESLNLSQEEIELKRLEYPDESSDSQIQQDGAFNSQLATCDSRPATGAKLNATGARQETHSESSKVSATSCEPQHPLELRLLVRRREAGALIGKRGSNIKRMRETFKSSTFNIPDTGNGPERVVCITTNEKSIDAILTDLTELLIEKSPENDDQIELKLLIHSSHAGSIIGIGGQSIKKLRNDSKAAIKIYEMCCPLSNERVCAIKAKPPIVVNAIKLIHSILSENPPKGTVKPYDALHFDLSSVEKYGGYLPEDSIDFMATYGQLDTHQFSRQMHDSSSYLIGHYPLWRSTEFRTHMRHPMNELELSDGKRLKAHHTTRGRDQPQGRSGKSDQLDQTKFQPESGQPTVADKNDQNPSRPTRFHPYMQQTTGNNIDRYRYSSSRQLTPVTLAGITGGLYPRVAPTMGQMQQRPQLVGVPDNIFPQLGEPSARCRHDRPCLCMFLPHVGVMQQSPHFVHLAKGFGHSRSPTYGYKRK